MTKFRIQASYGLPYSKPVTLIFQYAKTIASKQIRPEHILLACIEHPTDNWFQILDLLEPIMLQKDDIQQWLHIYKEPDDETIEGEVIAKHSWFAKANRAAYDHRDQFIINTGHFIIGILQETSGYLYEKLQANDIAVEQLITQYTDLIQPEPLPKPLDDAFLSFLYHREISVEMTSPEGETTHLTIPAITLMSELMTAYGAINSNAPKQALTQHFNSGDHITLEIVSP